MGGICILETETTLVFVGILEGDFNPGQSCVGVAPLVLIGICISVASFSICN